MNAQYLQTPTIIADLEFVNIDGDTNILGNKVVSIQAEQLSNQSNAVVTFDIPNFKRQNNLVLRFELFELLAALNMATLNADRSNVKS